MGINDRHFRIAIIGAGRIAQKMVEAVKKSSEISIVAIASRNKEKAQLFAEKNNIPISFGSYDEVLDYDEYDLIYIATINSTHFEIAQKCLMRHKPVAVEKPICLDLQQTQRLIELSEQNKTFITEAMPLRYSSNMRRAVELVSSGAIGETYLLQSNLGFPCWGETRINSPELGGGALNDLGVYGITLSRMFFPYNIADVSSRAHFDKGVDSDNTVVLTFDTGRTSICFHSVKNVVRNKAVIYGSNGFLIVSESYNANRVFRFSGIKHMRYYSSRKSVYLEEMECFKNSVEHGLIECPEYTHKEIIECAEISELVRDSWNQNNNLIHCS